MRAFFIFLFAGLILSCSQKVTAPQTSLDESAVYQSVALNEKNYMSCNFFADETFRGYIYRSSSNDNCLHIDITESPKALLRNEDLFLQIYPFRALKDDIEYGFSLPIYTAHKFDTEEVLIKSQVIDTHLIQVELGLEADHFFLDHVLEICDLDEKWTGLQFVIYERRQEDSVPIRITKFLKPPFLVHPEYFREKEGSGLAAYHPFLDYIPEFKSEPNRYYKLAEQVCSHL
ncbi:MAG: hypothetical protein OXJ52_06985 [Oligoflexia bacterium]|nr:hypothetical protein [Oligoflexia bacterium]